MVECGSLEECSLVDLWSGRGVWCRGVVVLCGSGVWLLGGVESIVMFGCSVRCGRG